MDDPNPILKEAEEYVYQIYSSNPDGRLVYHSFNHTSRIAKLTKEIAEGEKLSQEDKETVIISAWFHDSGFSDTGEEHEKRGAEIAEKWLKNKEWPDERIRKVKECILATNLSVPPQSHLEKILSDADLAYVGKKSYLNQSNLLRTEWELTKGLVIPQAEWIKSQIEFLQGQRFYTKYSELKFGPVKAEHINELVISQKQLKTQKKAERKKRAINDTKLDKALKPEKGIETMFRVISRNHMELSGMADNKASIMISISAIILSIAFSLIVPKLGANPYLVIPTFILLGTCLGTIVFATLSTRPHISGGKFTQEDLKLRKVNLLFFGNFYNMPYKDFEDGMTEMMNDKDFLYGSMMKDLYTLGGVLAKKYKLIRYSFDIFMFGLVITVVAFGVSFYLWGME